MLDGDLNYYKKLFNAHVFIPRDFSNLLIIFMPFTTNKKRLNMKKKCLRYYNKKTFCVEVCALQTLVGPDSQTSFLPKEMFSK